MRTSFLTVPPKSPADRELPDTHELPLYLAESARGGCWPSSEVCCFAETQYGVLCVEVESGDDLLACDDGGVSDPYFKVKYGTRRSCNVFDVCFIQSSNSDGQSALASTAEGTNFEQSMRTKYIAQTVTPQWNEEMVILVAYPFVDNPKVGCPRVRRHRLGHTQTAPSGFLAWTESRLFNQALDTRNDSKQNVRARHRCRCGTTTARSTT